MPVRICQCREITIEDLEKALKSAWDKKGGGDAQVTIEDTVPDLGDYNCGGCSRLFERAAEKFNETGAVSLLARSRAAGHGDGANGGNSVQDAHGANRGEASRSGARGAEMQVPDLRGVAAGSQGGEGLCAHAKKQRYTNPKDGPPNLLGNPIHGDAPP